MKTKSELIGSLQIVGFIHSGLDCTMAQVHGPTEYTICVTRHKTVEIKYYFTVNAVSWVMQRIHELGF
ncbi:hypothetical protein BD770DRAFT_24192 [Pilaira anomala]|nr:hypothetical protein BD770DRAFT_24192 [Pilaira anomala]